MALSHIGSKTTYLKVLNDLHQYGYIRHEKPKSKNWKSRVSVTRLVERKEKLQMDLFSQLSELPANCTDYSLSTVPIMGHTEKPDSGHQPSHYRDTDCPKNEPLSVPQLVFPINKNIKEVLKREKNGAPAPNTHLKNIFSEEEKDSFAGRAKCIASATPSIIPSKSPVLKSQTDEPIRPTLKQVHHFFYKLKQENNLSLELHKESEKFFAHYTANGWKLGGTTPIINWQAAAKKWILNSWNGNQYARSSKNEYHLSSGESLNKNQDYSTPL